MRYAVLGAGGVGALVGGALAKAGHPVTLLVRPARRDHYPERLTVESEMLGSFEAPVQVADRLSRQHFALSLRRNWAMASSCHCSTAWTMSHSYATATVRSGSCRGLYGSKRSR
jgi:hypothetical protein